MLASSTEVLIQSQPNCHICDFVDWPILHRVPKLVTPPASNTPNSVYSSWISTKYRTLHYLNISYRHTYYDICILPCVLSVSRYDVTSEFVYIKLTFSMLLLTKGSSGNVPALN